MTVLALEFSSARRSVALARGDVVLAEAVEQTDGRGVDRNVTLSVQELITCY